MITNETVIQALEGLRDQFSNLYKENPHDVSIILEYLRVYNQRLFDIGVSCIDNFKDERALFYNDVMAGLSEVGQSTTYHAGVLLGKMVTLFWVLGGPLDLWDCKCDYDAVGYRGMRLTDHVAVKNRFYEDAMWLEKHKRPEEQTELKDFYNSEDEEKIRIARDVIYHAENLQIDHKNDPIFYIDCYRIDYFLINGVLFGKRSASGWVLGWGWEYWEH